jgi:23S rRNA pseudouridine955/2504/2580 synthase
MILYEDDDIIIVNKPAGLAVQLGSKTRLAVDVMAKAYNPNLRLAHRIDKETSGLTVLAKNIETSRHMLFLFQGRMVKKKYVTIACGELPTIRGVIDRPLLKIKGRVVIDAENGRKAVTEFALVRRLAKGRALIEAAPVTGRMHQIRVHMSSIGCPILGDTKYGGRPNKHLCQHSKEISFVSISGKKIHVTAPIPEYFALA